MNCVLRACASDGSSLVLLRRREDFGDLLEALLPHADLGLDGLPLLELDLAEHVRLDHDELVHLVNLGVDDFVLDCLDCPHLDFVHLDLHVRVCVLGAVGGEGHLR